MKEKSKNRITLVTDVSESLANAIRRSSSEIPVLAINEIEFHKNDSALYDEILAHRIGLIPLTDTRKINEIEKCSCNGKGCNKCQIQITLKAKGPTTVYSGNLKGDVGIVYDKIPIVILDKDQELEFIGFARLGKSIKHAKFSPGLIFYRHLSKITINNPDKYEEIINKLGNHVISPQKGKVKTGDVIYSNKDVDEIESMFENEKDFSVEHGEKLVFFVESWGQIDPKDIIINAVKSLESNLKEVLKTIKK
ncbi:MAG: DNA-directed RNA polymerase subunit D [Candidatus Pacearchaeota archaeon]